MNNNPLRQNISTSIEVSIRLIFLFLLIGWCLSLLLPFITPVLWAIIIAVSVSPLYEKMNKSFGNKSVLTASILTLLLLAIILVPAGIILSGLAEDAHRFGSKLSGDPITIPPPNPDVAEWPIIGEKLFAAWDTAAKNPEQAIATYGAQLKAAGSWIARSAISLTGDIFKLLLSIIIAGVLLATPGTKEFTHRFFIKLVGARGEEFTQLSEKTIRNVTKGILGVAVIQSSLIGLILYFAGVPYAGLLTLACLILGIVQIPSVPVGLGAMIWLFSSDTTSTGMATLWSVLLILASLSDNVLKPILLGKGAPVPMLVIFLGAIGGFILSGFLGLFTGAIVLSLGYKLFISWISENGQGNESAKA